MSEQTNPVLAALRERRSIRKYTDDPVDKEALLQILEAGRWAPSGKNNQPWKFGALLAGDPRQEQLAGLTKYQPLIQNGKAFVGVFLEKSLMYDPVKDHQAAGACIQNMLLAAHALGLGGVWVGEILKNSPQVLELFHLSPEEYELMALLVFGHPAAKSASSRRELSELLVEAL